MKFNIKIFEVLDSTNTYLKKNYNNYQDNTIIVAKEQTHGRGRENRKWIDSKEDSLTFSILLKPEFLNPNFPKLTLMTCASIFEVLRNKNINVSIKWPNDILINNKKVCGILTETIFEGNKLECIIVGIGVNVNTPKFPDEIKDLATSLHLERSEKLDLDTLLNEILQSFQDFYDKFLVGDYSFIDICRTNFNLIGQKVKVIIHQEEKEVIILDVSNTGNLLINDNGVIKEVYSGEIILKRS